MNVYKTIVCIFHCANDDQDWLSHRRVWDLSTEKHEVHMGTDIHSSSYKIYYLWQQKYLHTHINKSFKHDNNMIIMLVS